MRQNKAINNFTGGEWTPMLDGRADLQKYDSACLRMENFRPLPWGGVTYRSGLEFQGFAKSGVLPCRLIPFNYSTTVSYVIEVGNLYMRFWNSNGTYTGAEIASPYTTAQLFQIQFKQINAQMRLVHPSVPPQTLVYTSAVTWAIGNTAWKYPVLMDQNATQALTLACSATTGSGQTLTAASALFNSNHVGSYWELQHLRASASAILDLNNQTNGATVHSSVLTVQGDWTFSTSQFWYGRVQIERSVDNGTTWTVIRDFTAKSDQNYSTSGTESAPLIGYPPVQYRITYVKTDNPFVAAVWVGAAPTEYAFAQASLEVQDAYIAGLVLVTGYTDTTHVTVTVVQTLGSTAATYLWSEGAFSTYRGFPATLAFYEQRFLYSGTAAQPNTIWGSVTGDFDNFQYSADDDGAVAFQPAVTQQNQTQWIATLLRVHLGTSGEEIIMASGNLEEALTPSNVTMRAQSYYGSTAIQPMLLHNSIIFVERNGQRVREMREMSPYVVPTDFVAPDLTLMAEHILKPGITQMDFGRLPDPLAYFVRSDGVLVVMTYNREQQVTAWARYVTNGTVESVAVIYGTPADEVWVSVNRTINGVSKRCIEVFTTDPASSPDIAGNLLLDGALQFLVGQTNPVTSTSFTAGATQITGLTYLASQTGITAVIDGAEYAGLTVSAGGVLAFPANVTATSIVNVGFPYTGYLTPMKTVIQTQDGTSQGRIGRIQQVVMRVSNSLSVSWSGGTSSNWQDLAFRAPGDTTGSATPLLAGVNDVVLTGPWPDPHTLGPAVQLRQTHPFPLTILGLFTEFDSFG
jgi:hypothetical protein